MMFLWRQSRSQSKYAGLGINVSVISFHLLSMICIGFGSKFKQKNAASIGSRAQTDKQKYDGILQRDASNVLRRFKYGGSL
jgi:hypothetical protein